MELGISKDFSELTKVLPWYLGGLALSVILYPSLSYIKETSLELSSVNLNKRLLNHIMRLPVSVTQSTHSGNYLAQFTVDVGKAIQGCDRFVEIICSLFIGNLASITYIFANSTMMAFITIGVAIMSLIFNGAFAPYLRKLNKQERDKMALLSERLSDLLTGHTLANTDNKKEYFAGKVIDAVDNHFFIGWKIKKVNIWASTPAELSRFLIDGVILATGVLLFNNGEMNMNQVMTCWTIGVSIGFSMRSIARSYVTLQGNLASGDRVVNLLNQSLEVGGINIKPDYSKPAIVFKDVCFSYGDDKIVFNNFSCIFDKGTSNVLVGTSGGGKSTAIKLILRYYDAKKGIILVFGKDVRDYSLKALRSLISYVPQSPVLFNSSIYENIRIGNPDALMEDIENAAKLAQIHDFIEELPEKYSTIVGERGTKLSGGQKQRIAIARAILKNAPILLMDEATSSLDNRFEKEVREALINLNENITVITITHRLNTIPNGNRILFIEQGKVIEMGTHTELMKLNKRYAKVFDAQLNESDYKAK